MATPTSLKHDNGARLRSMELDRHQPLPECTTTVFFSPNTGTYAVIRLNPVAMVKDLDDPEALVAAEALQTKRYLVYIEYVSVLACFSSMPMS